MIGFDKTNRKNAVAAPPVKFTGRPANNVAYRDVFPPMEKANIPLKSRIGPVIST